MKSIQTTLLPFDQLTPTQWQDVAAIEAESHLTPWSLASLQSSSDTRHTALALLIQHQVAGYLVMMHNVDDWELLNITVAPELQGLGLGRKLLHAGVATAQAANTLGIFLEVRVSNIAARALYERMGFVAVGLRKGYYRTAKADVQEDALMMRLDLDLDLKLAASSVQSATVAQ